MLSRRSLTKLQGGDFMHYLMVAIDVLLLGMILLVYKEGKKDARYIATNRNS